MPKTLEIRLGENKASKIFVAFSSKLGFVGDLISQQTNDPKITPITKLITLNIVNKFPIDLFFILE